jgi:hypothetical protein
MVNGAECDVVNWNMRKRFARMIMPEARRYVLCLILERRDLMNCSELDCWGYNYWFAVVLGLVLRPLPDLDALTGLIHSNPL